jgi:hypothetical protein
VQKLALGEGLPDKALKDIRDDDEEIPGKGVTLAKAIAAPTMFFITSVLYEMRPTFFFNLH